MSTVAAAAPAAPPTARRRRWTPAALWRRSLRVRITLTTLVLAGALISGLAVLLTVQIRDGLFTERLDQALEDAWRGAVSAQSYFDELESDSALAAGNRAQAMVSALAQSGTAADAVALDRGPNTPSDTAVNPVSTDASLLALAAGVVQAAGESGQQMWQSVALPTASGASTPGVVVGSPVTLLSSQYVILFAYDMAPEATTLSFIERTLGIASGAIVLILLAVSWMVAHQAARPVREAARVAERIAGGDFTERLSEGGADEFAALARSFNEMAASLEEQIAALEELGRLQRRFVADVSHELRTPLATIRMAGEVLHAASDTFPPAVARSAELLVTQIERFDLLLSDLLEISRFDANAASLTLDRRDLREVVAQVLDELAPLAERKGVSVRRFFAAEPVPAEVDARRVERVVRNLVANAIEHSEGKPVDVYLAGGADAAAVVVRDHGLGLSADDLLHVFDRFWRADPARARTTGGTGLGLAIAREDARLHGGDLDAWGRVGAGASFRLLLPTRAGRAIGAPPLSVNPEGQTSTQGAAA